MTRPAEDVEHVATLLRLRELAPAVYTWKHIEARTGVPRSTIRDWVRLGWEHVLDRRGNGPGPCDGDCGARSELPDAAYAYLLGMYLGDGCLSEMRKHVFKLRIFLDAQYPEIIEECAEAMGSVLPNKVGRAQRENCVELMAHSKHWRCLFPQHGPGMKHERKIALEPWQREIALDRHPDRFVRGLIHSDGCRVINTVYRPVAGERKRYEYVRFHLSNRSQDIKNLFAEACARLGVETRPNNAKDMSVARRESVAILEKVVGPKR